LNFCPSSNESNDNINQDCTVKLAIDFTTGLVNGWFTSKNQSFMPENRLEIETQFSLNDTSIKVNITYTCSMSDYCDLEFVRETLSPALAAVQIEPIRETLAAHLYNSSNTDPIKCSSNSSCPENISLCYATYILQNGISGSREYVESDCATEFDKEPEFRWTQRYTSFTTFPMTNVGVFLCNIPNCGSNGTVIETFQWLTREYILPLNISVLNVTTTTFRPTTTTSTISATTPNDASNLFGHFNIIIQCFVIILFLN
jgi:hypothetical protein